MTNIENLSPLAHHIYLVIANAFPGYLAVWTIAEIVHAPLPANFCGSGEWMVTDTAMKELVDAELIEELPDLRCRYQVKPGGLKQ